jgi:hypothetical protein
VDEKNPALALKPMVDPYEVPNRLLGAFEPASRARVELHLEPVKLALGTIVCEAGGFLEDAYFPKGAVLSLLTTLQNGVAVETANIGNEGAFGLFAAMYSRVSFNRCLVQLEGSLVRVPIEVVRGEFERSEHVRNLLVSYSETQLSRFSRPSRAIRSIQSNSDCAGGSS